MFLFLFLEHEVEKSCWLNSVVNLVKRIWHYSRRKKGNVYFETSLKEEETVWNLTKVPLGKGSVQKPFHDKT